MPIPINFYTWWVVIAIGCTSGVLLANIGIRGTGSSGNVLTKQQRQWIPIIGIALALGGPVFFVMQNAGAIAYEFNGTNVLPWLYASIGVLILGILVFTSGKRDFVLNNETYILVSERRRVRLAGIAFIGLAVVTSFI
jgi:hypothetical protein